jgi:hypothetical protein
MNVVLTAGMGFIPASGDVPSSIGSVVGLDDLNPFKPLLLVGNQTIAIPTAPAGPNSRIDIIEVNYDRRTENPLTRDVLDPVAGIFNPTLVNKTLAWAQDGRIGTVADPASSTAGISLKTGTPGVSPVAPSTTAGYTKIAQILVGSGVTSIAQNVIQDLRPLLFPGGILRASCNFLTTTTAGSPAAPTTMANIVTPPGVQMAVLYDDSTPLVTFYLMAGAIPSSFQGTVIGAPIGTFDAAYLYHLKAQDGGVTGHSMLRGTVNSTLQTAFAACTPSVVAAVGQPYVTMSFFPLQQSTLGALTTWKEGDVITPTAGTFHVDLSGW